MAIDDVTTAINKRKVFDRFIAISLLDFVGCDVVNSGDEKNQFGEERG